MVRPALGEHASGPCRCVAALGGFRRHISLGNVAGQGRAIALTWIAVPAAAGALQEKALARAHLDARGGCGLALLRRAEAQHKTSALAVTSAGDAPRRKARLVEAADDGRVFEKLILAPHREPAAPLPGATGIRKEIETRDAAGKLRFENLDRRGVQVGEVRRGRGRAVVPRAAAIGRA